MLLQRISKCDCLQEHLFESVRCIRSVCDSRLNRASRSDIDLGNPAVGSFLWGKPMRQANNVSLTSCQSNIFVNIGHCLLITYNTKIIIALGRTMKVKTHQMSILHDSRIQKNSFARNFRSNSCRGRWFSYDTVFIPACILLSSYEMLLILSLSIPIRNSGAKTSRSEHHAAVDNIK